MLVFPILGDVLVEEVVAGLLGCGEEEVDLVEALLLFVEFGLQLLWDDRLWSILHEPLEVRLSEIHQLIG